MNIRYANKSDKEWLKKNLLKDQKGRTKLNVKGSKEGDIIRLDDNWGATFIAEEKEEPRGIITVSYNSFKNCAYMDDLYIEKKFRKQGIATELHKFAIKYALDSWGGVGMYVLTLENKPMEKFLKQHGFKSCGVYNKCIQRGNRWIKQTYWLKEYDKT